MVILLLLCLISDVSTTVGVNVREELFGPTALKLAASFNTNPKVINVLLDNAADGVLKSDKGKNLLIMMKVMNLMKNGLLRMKN